MPNHTITNTTTGMLDMSPLCDLLGRRLTLRAQESRDIDDKTFNDDIVQRVIGAKWLAAKPHGAHPLPESMMFPVGAAAGEPSGPDDPADTGSPAGEPSETGAAAVPEPAPEAPSEASPEPAPAPEIPVEVPTTSEKPLVEPAASSPGKASKRR